MNISACNSPSKELPPGPYSYLPGIQGDECGYELYCIQSGELCQTFPFFESAHLAEMDACILAAALNAKLHEINPGWIVCDSRRAAAYTEFRQHFPGNFVVRNTSIGNVGAFAVYCDVSENVFCRVNCSCSPLNARIKGQHFCEALNDLAHHLDGTLADAGELRKPAVA